MSQQGYKVVLIEDEEMICQSLTTLLSRDGLQVQPYTHVDIFLKEQAWKNAEAVISDVSLPGMDGIELGLNLRKSGYSGPILYITALGELPISSYGPVLEPYLVVRKPFRSKDLLATVRLALKNRINSSMGELTEEKSEPKFEIINKEDLMRAKAIPVDLFFSLDEKGVRMLQVATAGESWFSNHKLSRAFDEGHRVYARRHEWNRYLADKNQRLN